MRKEVIEVYKRYGIDPKKAIETLKSVPLSIQCWQLDDIDGFLKKESLSGGIASTGNYPFKARGFDELVKDYKFALDLIPGKKKINLHAIYESDDPVDRSEISYKNFAKWIDFAKNNGYGIDFNPTVFSSEMLVDGLSLSSPKKEVRDYWVKHCINSIKISEKFGEVLNEKSLCNIWIPDGEKESPADRLSLRKNLKDSLDRIFEYKFDKRYCDVSLESKVFGIGVESFTVGSSEFYQNYCAHSEAINLVDMGHYHPTENVADKISSILLFNDKMAFHISRPVRWDSDHVVKLNDELQEVCDELVKCDALNRAYIGLDYFDGSINRVASLVIGARNLVKALLRSLLTPWETLKEYQNEGKHTEVLLLQEELKTLPWEEVYEEYLNECNVESEYTWFNKVKEYEKEVMSKRG